MGFVIRQLRQGLHELADPSPNLETFLGETMRFARTEYAHAVAKVFSAVPTQMVCVEVARRSDRIRIRIRVRAWKKFVGL
jgi:hypothetical protein